MGIVSEQGLRDSTITYLGVLIGAFNVILVYPRFLTPEQLGLYQYLVSTAIIISPLILLGSSSIVIRYFPMFREKSGNGHDLLLLLLLLPLAGALCSLLLAAVFKGALGNMFEGKDPLVRTYFPYIIPITLFFSVGMLLLNHSKNFMRFAVPSLLENTFVKLGSALIAVLLFYQFISLRGFVVSIVIIYALMMAGQAIYLHRLGGFRFQLPARLPDRPLLKEMSIYGLYSILGSLGATMMTWLDKAMIPLLIEEKGTTALGIYAIMAYIGTVIDVPKRSLEKITAPLLSQAFIDKDWVKIADLYSKTSINQLIIGLLFFLGIWLNIDDLLRIMPNGHLYAEAKIVVLFLGISALLDMITGNNSQIILFSDRYKSYLYILLVLVSLNAFFNYLFIGKLDMYVSGAALATLLAVGLFNLTKLVFIWIVWKIHPFSLKMLAALLIAAGVYLLTIFIPWPANPWLGLLTKSAFITLIYGSGIWLWKLSPDINALVNNLLHKIMRT